MSTLPATTTVASLTHQLTRADLDHHQRLAPAGCAAGALVGGMLGSGSERGTAPSPAAALHG